MRMNATTAAATMPVANIGEWRLSAPPARPLGAEPGYGKCTGGTVWMLETVSGAADMPVAGCRMEVRLTAGGGGMWNGGHPATIARGGCDGSTCKQTKPAMAQFRSNCMRDLGPNNSR